MSAEVKTRRNRRRQRLPKKKPVVTIESIAPGRAPLGVYPSVTTPFHHVEDRTPTPTSSEWPKPGSNCDSLHLSFGSRPSTLTPGPQLLPTEVEGALPLQLSSNTAKARHFSSCLPRTPLSSFSRYSIQSFTPSDDLERRTQSLPRNILSPLSVKESQIVLGMANKTPLARLHSQTIRSKNTAAPMQQGAVYELRNLDDLPSSQAISLSELCTKSGTRNKGSKSWKPLQLEETEDDSSKDSKSPAAFFGIGQNKPRSRLSALHRANSGECNLNKHTEEALIPSRFQSQGYSYTHEEQCEEKPRQKNANTIHFQGNPLSYSQSYSFPYSYSHPQQRSCISESPFLSSDGYHNPEHLPWPTDLPSISNELSYVGAPQPNLYYQSFMAGGNMTADSSFNIYSASFDHPDNQSPYESVPARYDQADAHEGFSAVHSFIPDLHDQSRNLSSISGDPSLNAPSGCALRTHAMECQSDTSTFSRAQPLNNTNSQNVPRIEPSVAEYSYNDARSWAEGEKHKELKDTVGQKAEGESAAKQEFDSDEFADTRMLLQNRSVESSAENALESEGMSHQVNHLVTASDSLQDHISESRQHTKPTDSEEVAVRPTAAEKPSLTLGNTWCDFTERWKANSAVSIPGHLNLVVSKRIRPPPGLSEPVAHSSTAWPSIPRNDPLLTQTRLDEADNWFHKDSWCQGQLREQVKDIAQNYAERIERVSGASHALEVCKVVIANQALADVAVTSIEIPR
ncbi:hypothetical protein ETB97_005586 [Aspergillus alliaceus]|uniref:Uncharacterized protein n=1 Tax=Petromyces alliaceus TaxID=209559 RepID=A0A8H6EA39_PETAA|nr:hypothetical protein ETB97_005586 [Aspergillus burnettii]